MLSKADISSIWPKAATFWVIALLLIIVLQIGWLRVFKHTVHTADDLTFFDFFRDQPFTERGNRIRRRMLCYTAAFFAAVFILMLI